MSSPHRFVVRRQEWTPPDATGVRRLLPEKCTRVAECRTADDAYKNYAELLADARRTLNPFHLGGPCLFYQTSLPPHALHDFLMDGGLTPPANSLSSAPNYAFWWVKHNRTFTDAEREHVWAACDKLKLFDVLEEDDREAAHVVVEILPTRVLGDWDDELKTKVEGGVVRSAYHTRRKANRAARSLGEGRRQDLLESDLCSPDDLPDATTLATVNSIPLTGVGENVCWVLTRPSIVDTVGSIERCSVQMPLLAFATHQAAHDRRVSLIQRTRRIVNPFRLMFPVVLTGRVLADVWEEEDPELPNGLTFTDAVAAVRQLPTHVPAPADDAHFNWVAWYDRVVQWSPEYLDVIWGTFADFRLFEVIEVPLH